MAKLTNLNVHFLSLVGKPATGKGLTLKSVKPNQTHKLIELTKTDDEQQIAYGIVYTPDQEDSHGDYADAATIRRAAHEFMRHERTKQIDADHSFETLNAHVAESWLIKSSDGMFPDEPEGAWAVGIKVYDPDTWQKLKSGGLTGISLAGVAQVKPDQPRTQWVEPKEEVPNWFRAFIEKFTPKPVEEKDMTEEKIKQLIKESVGAAVTEALKSAGTGENVASAPREPDPLTMAPPASLQKTEDDAIAAALAKGFEALEGKIDDKITKALAKGAVETGAETQTEETFL